MFNKIILAGNLTRDVQVRYSGSNLAIGNTGLAVNRKFKSQSGEQKEEVLFVDITFFGRTAEIANQYLRKGSKVLVEGRLKLEQWTDATGGKRSKHTVTVDSLQMLDSKEERKQLEQDTFKGYTEPTYTPTSSVPTETTKETKESEIVNETDIPF